MHSPRVYRQGLADLVTGSGGLVRSRALFWPMVHAAARPLNLTIMDDDAKIGSL